MRMVATSLVLAVGLTVALIPAAGAAEGQTEIVEDIETVVAVADPASPDFPTGSLMRADCEYLVRVEAEDGSSQEWMSCTLSDRPMDEPTMQGSVPTSVVVDAGGECIWGSDYWTATDGSVVYASEFEVVTLPSGRVHSWAAFPAEPLECATEEAPSEVAPEE
jgi:hypothetical protein